MADERLHSPERLGERDEAERARNDAQSEERRLRDEAGKANAEAKAARDEAGRLAGELKAARRALEQAKKERDRAEKAKKGGA